MLKIATGEEIISLNLFFFSANTGASVQVYPKGTSCGRPGDTSVKQKHGSNFLEMIDIKIFIRLIGDQYDTSEKKRAVTEATALICTLKSLESKFYCSHFPQLLHPLQVGRIPQFSHFSRKYGLYLSSLDIG